MLSLGMPDTRKLSNLSQGLFALLGTTIIVLALASYITNMTLDDLFEWVETYFSVSFSLIFLSLLMLGLYSVYQIHNGHEIGFYYELGQQAGNGISTLALTFTLLGISLGIGTLAGQSLNPETVQSLIGELTAQFSMAFMTTVLGLPTATLIRALVAVRYAARINAAQIDKAETD